MKFEGAPKSEPVLAEPEKKKERSARPAKVERLSRAELRERKTAELDNLIGIFEFSLAPTEVIRSLSQKMRFLKYVNQKEVAQCLVDNGYGWAVANKVSRFDQMDQAELAMMLLDGNEIDLVTKNLNEFPGATHEKIVRRLMTQDIGWVIDNLQRFKKIGKLSLREIMEYGGGLAAVADNLGKFPELNPSVIVRKLIDHGEYDAIARNLSKFPDQNRGKFLELLIDEDPDSLLKNLDQFKLRSHKELVDKLVAAEQYGAMAPYVGLFKGVDNQDLALQMIDRHLGSVVAKRIVRFTVPQRLAIAQRMIFTGQSRYTLEYLPLFPPSALKILAEDFLDTGRADFLMTYKSFFQDKVDLGKIIGERLKKLADHPADEAKELSGALPLFDKIGQRQTQLLITHGYTEQVAKNIDKFEFSDREKVEFISKHYKLPKELVERLHGSEYGMRLLTQFGKYDGRYQDKIRDIATLQLEAGRGGGFRRENFQKLLLDFGRNEELVRELHKSGINVDAWLNFNQRDNFKAGVGERNPIEWAKVPLVRIARDMNHVLIKLRLAKNDSADLVKAMKFPETAEEKSDRENQISEVSQQIGAIKIRMAGMPPEKVGGMERAIAGLTGKAEKLQISRERNAEDVLNGSITNFHGAKNSFFEKIKKFYELKPETPAAKEEGLKGALRDEIFQAAGQMDKRYAEIREILERINQVGGREIFNSVGIVGEEMEHLKQDVNQITAAFADAEKTKGHRFSIGVWERNMAEDLFLGNYTDCCIRVDSTYDGSKLTTLDYLADLGIQVVVVRDEAKNRPVYAAWCWLGKNDDGQTALVIDNIEGYPTYANRYRGIMKEKIFSFAANYGKAIGVDKVVLGPQNNDVRTSDMKYDEGYDESSYRYEKLGGQSDSPDQHYYLEAFDTDVLLVSRIKPEPGSEK